MIDLHPGQEMLDHIRALAEDRIADLESMTVTHFDGVERRPADPAAIAERETCAAIVRLCDFVAGNVDVLPRAVRALAASSSAGRK